MSILELVFCWVPILRILFGFLGFLFSLIGVFKRPRGAAIAGLIIWLIGVIAIVVLNVFFGTAVLPWLEELLEDLDFGY